MVFWKSTENGPEKQYILNSGKRSLNLSSIFIFHSNRRVEVLTGQNFFFDRVHYWKYEEWSVDRIQRKGIRVCSPVTFLCGVDADGTKKKSETARERRYSAERGRSEKSPGINFIFFPPHYFFIFLSDYGFASLRGLHHFSFDWLRECFSIRSFLFLSNLCNVAILHS